MKLSLEEKALIRKR